MNKDVNGKRLMKQPHPIPLPGSIFRQWMVAAGMAVAVLGIAGAAQAQDYDRGRHGFEHRGPPGHWRHRPPPGYYYGAPPGYYYSAPPMVVAPPPVYYAPPPPVYYAPPPPMVYGAPGLNIVIPIR